MVVFKGALKSKLINLLMALQNCGLLTDNNNTEQQLDKQRAEYKQ